VSIDAMSGFTDVGLIELDGLVSLRYFKFVHTQTHDPLTIHVRQMTKLETLILDGGEHLTDADMNSLQLLVAVRHLTLSGRGISADGVEKLNVLSQLKTLSLDIAPADVLSASAIDQLRAAIPGLWVDW
jgi:hypothetical protein